MNGMIFLLSITLISILQFDTPKYECKVTKHK